MFMKAIPTIFATTATSFGAFVLGLSYSPVPMITSFCAFAAINVVLNFLVQLSFFSAFVYLDELRRVEKLEGQSQTVDYQADQNENEIELEGAQSYSEEPVAEAPSKEGEIFPFLIRVHEAWFVALVLIVFCLSSTASLLAFRHIGEGLAVNDLLLEDSYLIDFYKREYDRVRLCGMCL